MPSLALCVRFQEINLPDYFAGGFEIPTKSGHVSIRSFFRLIFGRFSAIKGRILTIIILLCIFLSSGSYFWVFICKTDSYGTETHIQEVTKLCVDIYFVFLHSCLLWACWFWPAAT